MKKKTKKENYLILHISNWNSSYDKERNFVTDVVHRCRITDFRLDKYILWISLISLSLIFLLLRWFRFSLILIGDTRFRFLDLLLYLIESVQKILLCRNFVIFSCIKNTFIILISTGFSDTSFFLINWRFSFDFFRHDLFEDLWS